MGMFDAIDTATTGVDASQTWMDAISNNLANMNDVTSTSQPAYQAEYPDVAADTTPVTGPGGAAGVGSGVEVTGLTLGSAQGIVEHDPSSPLADAAGNVRTPNVDMAQQMTDLIMAQRGYEANLNTISQATQAYQAALGLKL